MKRALLLIDVQEDYFRGALPVGFPAAAASLGHIVQAMEAARAAGLPVLLVKHLAPPGSALLAQGSPGAELRPELLAHEPALTLEKRQPSAMVGTPLDAWLRQRGIDTLALAGYLTHNCIDATARDAAQRCYHVELLADACGSVAYANRAGRASAQALHEHSLVVLQARFAAVMGTGAWIANLANGAAPAPEGILPSALQARRPPAARAGDPVLLQALDAPDLDRIASLWEGLRQHHADRGGPFKGAYAAQTFAQRKAELLAKARTGSLRVTVARVPGTADPVGYCVCSVVGRLGEIDSLYLDEAHRGERTGARLAQDALAWMAGLGATRRVVTVYGGNEESLGFYRRQGFDLRRLDLEIPGDHFLE